VRFLGIARLGLVNAHFLGYGFFAVFLGDDFAHLTHRIGGEIDRVRAHVGDEADAAFTEIHTFIKLLCQPHRALRRIAQLARGLLLQRGGGERRRRVAAPLFLVDGDHMQEALRGILDGLLDVPCAGLVGEAELLHFLARELDQLQRKSLRAVFAFGLERPVFLGFEDADLLLALADHAQRRTLHAAGRQAAAHFLPEQRREIETDQVVERASRLLGVHQVKRQVARFGHRALHLALGDFVEHHALDFLALEVAALFEQLAQMPGNGFAFTVRVGGEEEVLGFLERTRDGFHVLFVALDRLVTHLEVLVGIDSAFLGDEVAHVAIGSKHLEILAEVFLDGFRFRGRFDDY
jgi:hypothetical protein